MSDKHSKHVKLSKASVGDFARNELGIVGPNCDEIKKLAQQWATALGHRFKSVYVDQDHAYLHLPCPEQLENSTIAKAKHLTGKHWERLEQNLHPSYSEKALDYDLAFLNGNHFLATSSILIYQTSRHNKLIKKDLSTVTCVVSSYKDKEQALGLTSANCQWIDMDDEMGIPRFIELTFPKPKLNALILSGGKSTRMGTDKGALNYHGEPQRVHLEQLLEKHVHGVYHSVRSEQGLNLDNKIEDRFVDLGPFGAILSGMMFDPDAAWLVLACDLPNVDHHLLDQLVKGRKPSLIATAFHNPQTNWPDPLCTIYEPKAYLRMLSFLARGNSCPRKVLINSEIELLDLKEESMLDNINTPEQYQSSIQG